MNGIKGILFDFGGTLDTNGTHWGIMLQEAYREARIFVGRQNIPGNICARRTPVGSTTCYRHR